ncbi:MAG: alpha/beta fold hydrolase [Alphaproteobacteria bacterium]
MTTDSAAAARLAKTSDILARADGSTIAYHLLAGVRTPGVVFLPGFRSDMQGGKALALEALCRAENRPFVRFDYTGHGQSSGHIEDGTIGSWTQDVLDVLDRLIVGPVVLVGSSMGGWIMLLAALARKSRIAGLVGVAPAPDFTEDLIWNDVPEAVRKTLREKGVYYEVSQYSPEPTPITLKLIEDGRRRLVLRAPIELDCPVRLIHGLSDSDVPWQLSLRLADTLTSRDVAVTLVKHGDHRLSEPADLARLCRTVSDVCAIPHEVAANRSS